MNAADFITSLPSWGLFVLIVGLCLLFAEIGSRVAHYRVNKGVTEPEAPVGTAVGAMLGLLAFMLGFTFSITAERFASRKALSIEQANAIGTCYVRTSIIPEKQKQAIRILLKEYTDLLLSVNEKENEEVTSSVLRLEKINLEIWKHTSTLAQEDMDSELRTFFSGSVNEMMEKARERKTVALVFRIPGMLWTALFFLTAICMFSIGFQTGNSGRRRIFDLPLLAIAFALVVVLIADMDSTGKHRLKVNLQPLKDVQDMMQENIP